MRRARIPPLILTIKTKYDTPLLSHFQGHRESGRTEQFFADVTGLSAHGSHGIHVPKKKAEEARQGKSWGVGSGRERCESSDRRVPTSVSQSTMELLDEKLSQREESLRQDRRQR